MKDRTNWNVSDENLELTYSTPDSEITQWLVEMEKKLTEMELKLNQILDTLQ
jgi:hypothetical protein